MEPWRTGITTYDDSHIWIQGYDVAELMTTATFADVVFLLHKGRLPSEGERRIMDAILIASADHGPGSPSAAAARTVATGNRAAPEAAIAAGVLAIGDAHGGAGLACLELITASIGAPPGTADGLSALARRALVDARENGRHVPGIGHRTHSVDPRTAVLFELAQRAGLPSHGIAFMRELEREAAALIKPLPINIDGAIAAVLFDLGFAPALAKLFFIVGRVAGLSAQIVEEYTRERAMRITVPVTYDGPAPRAVAAPGKGAS